VTELWYKGKEDYDFDGGVYTEKTGAFTQMIWRNTRFVGFGVAQTDDNMFYVVANYYPAGNVVGEFKENVFSTFDKPVLQKPLEKAIKKD
jgi:hypothetical protein